MAYLLMIRFRLFKLSLLKKWRTFRISRTSFGAMPSLLKHLQNKTHENIEPVFTINMGDV